MSRKNNFFKSVPVKTPRRNLFDLSHEVRMSGKFGYLYPVLLMDTMPGDTIRDDMQAFLRFAPMLAPIMHRVDVTTHFFFVPNRLLWDNWETFITGGQDGTEAPVPPYVTIAGIKAQDATVAAIKKGTLWDYFGLPVFTGAPGDTGDTTKISVLPFKAMMKIWNDYYRDPNLDTEFNLSTATDGNSVVWLHTEVEGWEDYPYNLRRRGWEKDYFTACLPWAQRGAQVLMPFEATVDYLDVSLVKNSGGLGTTGALTTTPGDMKLLTNTNIESRIENIESIENSSIFINDFRNALAIQAWMESNARGGGRYMEQIQSHFDVRVPDFRLQRAEYLGGGKQPVQISEVLSTADTVDVPVGDMAGHGISVGRTNRFTYRCQEHGWVIGIMSIMPKTGYQQGIEKMWLREDKFDHGWPELANLGEQEVKGMEIFYSTLASDNDDNIATFGYIPRYSEYKFKNDRVAGDFRTSLAFWGLTRIFTERPLLTNQFTTMIEDGGSIEETYRRIFAVQDGTDYLWINLNHRLTAKRPLPYFGVPQLMG